MDATALASSIFESKLGATGAALDEVLGYAPDDGDGPGGRLSAKATEVNGRLLDLQAQWVAVRASSRNDERLSFLRMAWPELQALAQRSTDLRRELLEFYFAAAKP